jgi:ankyrin repeat protein
LNKINFFIFQEACARVLLFRGADINIVNKSNKTPYELALVSQNNSIASLIQSHKIEHVVPFRESPLINPKRRSIYIEQDRDKHRARSSSTTTPSSSLTSRSQSMPKLNANQSPITTPTIEHYFQQQHPSSRSSSPKSFSVNSDHGFGSECNSHLSSGIFIFKYFLNFLLNK